MKYFDVVANRRACLWYDEKAISPKPPKVQTAKWNSDLLGGRGGHDVIEFKDWCETITWCCRCVEESSLRLAVKQSQLVTFRLA